METAAAIGQEFLGMFVMFAIGGILIYLAIKKDYEPALLLPIGFGAILTNIPMNTIFTGMDGESGVFGFLYNYTIANELFPVLIFIAVGAMIDFTPLFQTPFMLFFGAAAQFGIFATMLVALLLGFNLPEAGAIGVIGAADGPTSIYVANAFKLDKGLIAAITVAAYSYMSLVPIIQPPVIKLLTTPEERKIRMDFQQRNVSKLAKILFPILVTIVAGLIAPESVALVGGLMPKPHRECGVLNRLSNSPRCCSLVTLLWHHHGTTMTASSFLNWKTNDYADGQLPSFLTPRAVFCLPLAIFSGRKRSIPWWRRRDIGLSHVCARDSEMAERIPELRPDAAVAANVSGQRDLSQEV